MSDNGTVTISGLPAAGPLLGGEVVAASQAGATVKLPAAAFATAQAAATAQSTADTAQAATNYTAASGALTLPTTVVVSDGGINLTSFASRGALMTDGRAALAALVAVARTLGVEARINAPLTYNQTSISDSIRLYGGDRIRFINGAVIYKSNPCVSIFYHMFDSGTANSSIHDARFVFTGTIPQNEPTICGQWASFIQNNPEAAPFGVQNTAILNRGDYGACVLSLYAPGIRLTGTTYFTGNTSISDVSGLMINCISMVETNNAGVEDARLDYTHFGIVCYGVKKSAGRIFSSRRGSADNFNGTLTWTSPGHVIYNINPTGHLSEDMNYVIFEDANEVPGSNPMACGTLKVHNVKRSYFRVQSEHPQGVFAMADTITDSDFDLFWMGTSATRLATGNYLRILSGAQSNNRIKFKGQIPDGCPVLYLGGGDNGVSGLAGCNLDISIDTATTLASNNYLFILYGTRNHIRYEINTPNLTGTVALIARTTGTVGYNRIDVDLLAPDTATVSVRPQFAGATTDCVRWIDGKGQIVVQAHGAQVRQVPFDVTATIAAASTAATLAAVIPAGARVDSLNTVCKVAPGVAFDVGDGTTVGRWGRNGGSAVGSATNNAAWAAASTRNETTAQSVVLTPVGGSFTNAATVRVSGFYTTGLANNDV